MSAFTAMTILGEATEPHPPAYWAGYYSGLAILILIVALAIRSVSRRSSRPRAAVRGPGVAFTPDGRYWWSGAAWVDADAFPPPSAQFTPDWRFWWDGVRWRPAPLPVGSQNPLG